MPPLVKPVDPYFTDVSIVTQSGIYSVGKSQNYATFETAAYVAQTFADKYKDKIDVVDTGYPMVNRPCYAVMFSGGYMQNAGRTFQDMQNNNWVAVEAQHTHQVPTNLMGFYAHVATFLPESL